MVMKMTPGPIRATKRAAFLSLLISTIALAACSGGDGTGPAKPTPGSMSASSTPNATATVGAAANVAPSVIVTGTDGKPLAGVPVTFAVTGGGTLGATTATTDAAGQASAVSWTLGTLVGTNTVTASASGVAPVTFTVNTTAGPTKSLEKVAGDVQS